MIPLVMGMAVAGSLRQHVASLLADSWLDGLWEQLSWLLDAVGLIGLREWLETLDSRMALLLGVLAVILFAMTIGRIMLPRDEQRAGLAVEQRPRLPLPARDQATEQNWVPEIARRLGLDATDRRGLIEGIEQLRSEMQELFDQFESRRTVPSDARPASSPLWHRLVTAAGDGDVRAITQSVLTLERTHQALSVTLAARFLEQAGRDERAAALDGYGGGSLQEAIAWWRIAVAADAADGRGAGPVTDETARRMTHILLRSDIVTKTYLAEQDDYLHFAAALSAIAGGARQMFARANWTFDRPRLLAWQPSTSANEIQRVYVSRPERIGSNRGAVTPEKRYYLQFLQQRTRELDTTKPLAMDIVELGYRTPDQQWEPSRLVSYNPAEWV